MKKGKSHKLSRMKTFDELMKGKKPGKPAILLGMDPSKAVPMAITMQENFMGNDLDATKCYLYAPSSWTEE